MGFLDKIKEQISGDKEKAPAKDGNLIDVIKDSLDIEEPAKTETKAEPAAPAAPAAPPQAEAPKAAPAKPAAKKAPAKPKLKTYTVKSGDTLSEIGAKYGVSYQSIAKLNGIDNPDLIFPGQVFKIPNK